MTNQAVSQIVGSAVVAAATVGSSSIKDRFTEAVANYKLSSRGIVIIFEEMLDAYATDRHPEDLAFAINALVAFPRLQKQTISIVRNLIGAKIEKPEGSEVFTVSVEKISKKKKAEMREKVAAFIAAEYTSLLNWEAEKSERAPVAFDQLASCKKIKQALTKQIEAGLSKEMALTFLNQLINEVNSMEETAPETQEESPAEAAE